MGKNSRFFRFIISLLVTFSVSSAFAFQTEGITISLQEKVNVTCPGASTGAIRVETSGGVGELSFSWTGPGSFSANTEDLSGIKTGDYVLEVTDQSAPNPKTATAEFRIIQSDTEKPTLIAPADIIHTPDSGKCTATQLDLGDAITSDNCHVESITHNAPPSFSVGETKVTWWATDASGNTSTADQLVIIEDKEDPKITAPGELTVYTDPGSCTANNIALGSPVTSDNCGVKNVNNDAPVNFTLGETIVTWTVVDAAGNTATSTQLVHVLDKENPVISAPADLDIFTDANSCYATGVNLGNPTTSDNCTIDSFTNNAPTQFSIGTTEITWTVTDGSGNTATTIQKVTVTDNIAPSIIAPMAVTKNTDLGSCTATGIFLGSPTTNDNCNSVSVDNNAPVIFPIGTTIVTWTATDDAGNITTATQEVTINDIEAPKVEVQQNIVVEADSGSCSATGVSLGTNTISDNCKIASTENDAPDVFNLGTTTVTWTVSDESGNITTAIQKVTVEDKQLPTITAPRDVASVTDRGKCTSTNVALGSPIAEDNCAGFIVENNAPSIFPIGITEVLWTITDGSGNTATALQSVIITDEEKPAITPPANVVTTTDSESCTAIEVPLGSASVTDNCSGVEITNDAPSSFSMGTTTVTWTATDAAGNQATAVQTVTIKDSEAPVIQAPGNIEVNNDFGKCNALVTVTIPVAIDNCSVGTPTGTRKDGKALTAAFPVGITEITWNVKDESGNQAVPVIQKVTVIDNEAPVAPVLEDIIWGCEYTLEVPVANDNCSGSIQATTTDPLTYSTPGAHTVTWTFTDSHNNSTIVEQIVNIEPVAATATVSPVLCNGFSTGQITLNPSGGVAPYTFTWNSLGTGASKNNLAAGTYTVTISDVNGCEMAPMDIIIEEPETFIEITQITSTAGCSGLNNATATAEVTGGTGNYSFLWDDGQTTQTAEALSPGKHTVIVTDENGCTATRSVTIESPESLVITGFSTTETTSFGSATGMATVNISGGTAPYSFEWSNEQDGQIARNLQAGEYSVTVTDANNCSTTDSVIIIDSIEGIIVPSSLCETEEGGIRVSTFKPEAVRGGTGPYTYTWNFGQDAVTAEATGAGPHVVAYTSTGDKTISMTITDSVGLSHTETIVQYVGECFEVCGNTENFDVNLSSFFIGKEDGTALTSSDCSYTGKKYIFLKSTTNANAYSPSVEYIYTLRDLNNGGAVVGTYNVISCLAQKIPGTDRYEMIPELLNLGEVAEWSCGYSITMENFFMSWTNNNKRGCGENPKMMCLSTNENDEIIYPLYASIKTTDLLCFGSSSGSLTVSASGGEGPYEFSLNGGPFVTNNIFSNLDGGTYTVTVKDNNGQIYEPLPKEINEPANPLEIKKPVVNTPVTCFGGNDGSATVEVSGGSPFTTGNPYIYVWSNGQTSVTATGLSAGEYSVTIIDANGCELTESITIVEPEYVPADAGENYVLPCGTNSTTIGTNIPEGVSGTWEVVNGPSGWELEDANSPLTTFTGNIGTYTLRWTVSCGATDDVKISIGDCNTIDFDGQDDHIDFGNTFDLASEFSVEAWVKPESITGIRTILSKRNSADYTTSGYDLVLNEGKPEFRWSGGKIASTIAIGTDRWYHLSITSNSTETKLYVDGIEMIKGSAATSTENTHPFLVGALFDGSQLFGSTDNFHGWIEEVRVWKTALTTEQLRFMMNQRLENNGGFVKGKEIPFNVPGELSWTHLTGYYHMEIIQNGYTLGQTETSVQGKLRNITTLQQRSAPLPYISKRIGNWNDMSTTTTPWLYGQGIWESPNSLGINRDSINWNIVRTRHDITSDKQDLTLLGLFSEKGKLSITDAAQTQNEYNSGHSLNISHYLDLNGVIDLVGESQLIQGEGSILEEASSGYIERDQQGTASSYNYNYWTSPVSPIGSSNNSGYTVDNILRDGTNSANPVPLVFNYQYHFADGAYSGPKRISTYWIHVFTNKQSNSYSKWHNVREKGSIKAGEGFSMKGTSGSANIEDQQNYVFVGKPNNGDISLEVNTGNDYLVGNPYPSAIDGYQFIRDNIAEGEGNNSQNVFNGTLYFWDHFSGKTHYLQEYIGGYATLNLSGGLEAVATDARINATGEKADIKPEQFIPVGQAFYVSTKLAPELQNLATVHGGEVKFKNSQRYFETDDQTGDLSVFKSQEATKSKNKSVDDRQKIYLKFRSPQGYHRQILATRDPVTSTGYDLGYDAALIENNKEDMYWMISNYKFVIQGVPDFEKSRVMPLGIKIHSEGTFKIEIDRLLNIPDDFNIYLKDSLEGVVHDLRNGAYEATSVAGVINDRLSIIFEKIEDPEEEESEGPEEGSEKEGNTGEETGEETGAETGEGTDETEGSTETEEENNEIEQPVAVDLELSYSNKNAEIWIKNPAGLSIKNATLYNALGQKLTVYNQIPQDLNVVFSIGRRAPGVYLFRVEYDGQSKGIRFIVE